MPFSPKFSSKTGSIPKFRLASRGLPENFLWEIFLQPEQTAASVAIGRCVTISRHPGYDRVTIAAVVAIALGTGALETRYAFDFMFGAEITFGGNIGEARAKITFGGGAGEHGVAIVDRRADSSGAI